MRRLTRYAAIRRLADEPEKGASAIIVILMMTVLLGVAGLSIDIGASFAKRQEVQNAADAAALAVASQCAIGKTAKNCPADLSSAQTIADPNEGRGTAIVEGDDIDYAAAGYRVTVTVAGTEHQVFAPAVGGPSEVTVRRSATAVYGSPVGGTTTLPIIVSECLFPGGSAGADFGELIEIWLPKNATHAASGGCAEADYPSGGFGWLAGDDCTAVIGVGNKVESDPGKSPPNGCPKGSYFADLADAGTTVLVPLFSTSSGSGFGGQYTVTRFAAFEMTGFESQTGTHSSSHPGCQGSQPTWATGFCFQGKFLEFVDDPGDFELGGPLTDLVFIKLVG
ncbi:pilus assembly protein TadG-related protein [Ornithinimicrobium faecis]|uniref:pilus assembly protein TadG-related protein n=1 Tax=Ornithinimicrobium faecis TaxID=2934158 RepID=UPI002117B2FA|nr:pilus assembly protein TadG-related protein [Ornithinimicrobium sp. HY1745]